MSPEVVFIREYQTVEDVLVHLRQRGELPPQTDRLFVVDSRNVLRGSLPLQALLLNEPAVQAGALMTAPTASASVRTRRRRRRRRRSNATTSCRRRSWTSAAS